MQQIEVARANEFVIEQCPPHPVDQLIPISVPHQHDGEMLDALRLHERDGFKQFIQRPKAARKKDKARGVFDEANFANEKVSEVQEAVYIRICLLFVW